MAIRVVISDSDPTFVHGNAVKGAIIEGYGSDISDQIEIRIEGLSISLAYAQSIGAIAVVRSTSGLETFVIDALPYWSTIITFVAMPNNDRIEVLNPASIPTAVVTSTRSSGSIGDSAEGAYGDCLEFLDTLDGGNSGANGRVTGKLLRIYDTRGKGWIDARVAARFTASQNGRPDKFHGYGFIDVDAANAYINIFDMVDTPFVPVVMNLPNTTYVYTS